MSTAAIVLTAPLSRLGVEHPIGTTLCVPTDEAAALIAERLALPAGLQLEIERRPIVGRFVSRPRQ